MVNFSNVSDVVGLSSWTFVLLWYCVYRNFWLLLKLCPLFFCGFSLCRFRTNTVDKWVLPLASRAVTVSSLVLHYLLDVLWKTTLWNWHDAKSAVGVSVVSACSEIIEQRAAAVLFVFWCAATKLTTGYLNNQIFLPLGAVTHSILISCCFKGIGLCETGFVGKACLSPSGRRKQNQNWKFTQST